MWRIQGILTADLELLPTAAPQPPFSMRDKLPRLLELGAQFLNAIAPSMHHVAKQQSRLLNSLLQAGFSQPQFHPAQRLPHLQPLPWSVPDPALVPREQPLPAVADPLGLITPGIDLALNALVDLSEFGDNSFWDYPTYPTDEALNSGNWAL